MRYESGTKYIFLILQMLVKCCFLETILRYCGSGVELQLLLTCAHANLIIIRVLELPPNHLIHDSHIALDDLHYLGAYVLVHIVRHRDSMLTIFAHRIDYYRCMVAIVLVEYTFQPILILFSFATMRISSPLLKSLPWCVIFIALLMP